MQSRKPRLPPSRSVLVLLPLTLIEALDRAADVLKMNRTDLIRRSLMRDVPSLLKEEVARTKRSDFHGPEKQVGLMNFLRCFLWRRRT